MYGLKSLRENSVAPSTKSRRGFARLSSTQVSRRLRRRRNLGHPYSFVVTRTVASMVVAAYFVPLAVAGATRIPPAHTPRSHADSEGRILQAQQWIFQLPVRRMNEAAE
jgi:hypothetical protein